VTIFDHFDHLQSLRSPSIYLKSLLSQNPAIFSQSIFIQRLRSAPYVLNAFFFQPHIFVCDTQTKLIMINDLFFYRWIGKCGEK
jgi:hypothetical protein